MFSRNWFYLVIFVGIAAFLLGAPLWVDVKGNPGNPPQNPHLVGPAASVHIKFQSSNSDTLAVVDGFCGSIPVSGTLNLGAGSPSEFTEESFIDRTVNPPANKTWNVSSDPLRANLQACYNSTDGIFTMQFQSIRNFTINVDGTREVDAVLLRQIAGQQP